MRLLLIRHGATKANEEGRYVGGRTEEALTEGGKRHILGEKTRGKYPSAQVLASSPMKRCLETAKLIYEREPAIVIEEWREINFGSFEGKNYEELRNDTCYRKWLDSNGVLPCPQGESREEFIERCSKGFVKLCGYMKAECAETAAAVVHGGTIMAVLSSFGKGEYYDFQCKNAEGYCLEVFIDGELRIENIQKL
ncbi:alpha-ribazole phosphatase [Kineothrix alysoides]|uniref:Alpha-ribazole phosphatase n=1 Tax=Kineothrix alysoides TaxID=1469948 RepID=A0A4R1QWY4_9FIRM|nr:histidine phosphatase family protein [Kineothrix alysoides]TCL57495.1 alpha-ribazole phosphatase [Kineothrix alysoides]